MIGGYYVKVGIENGELYEEEKILLIVNKRYLWLKLGIGFSIWNRV